MTTFANSRRTSFMVRMSDVVQGMFLVAESKKQQFPPCGFVRNNDGEIITKHDKEMTGRRNCNKMMQVVHQCASCIAEETF